MGAMGLGHPRDIVDRWLVDRSRECLPAFRRIDKLLQFLIVHFIDPDIALELIRLDLPKFRSDLGDGVFDLLSAGLIDAGPLGHLEMLR